MLASGGLRAVPTGAGSGGFSSEAGDWLRGALSGPGAFLWGEILESFSSKSGLQASCSSGQCPFLSWHSGSWALVVCTCPTPRFSLLAAIQATIKRVRYPPITVQNKTLYHFSPTSRLIFLPTRVHTAITGTKAPASKRWFMEISPD